MRGGRVVTTVRRSVCFSAKSSKRAPKARATGAPFTGRAANQEPGLAEHRSQSPLKERSDEHDACMNTARLGFGASGHAPRHARARWYDWARRRSYCMEWMRVVTEQRLRVQTGACAHELFMPYVRVTVIMACARRSCTMWAPSHPRRLPGRGQRRWHARCTWCARAAVSGRVRRARAPRARAPLCAPVVRSFVEVDFGVYGEPVWLEIDDAAVPIAHGGCSGHVRDACGSLGAILRQKQVGKKCFGFRPASAATRRM